MSSSASSPASIPSFPWDFSPSATLARFQALLRIRSITAEGPAGANAACVAYLSSLGRSIGLSSQVLEFTPGRPILLLCLPGVRSELKSLLLNSHYDVVPVSLKDWSVDPFAGHIDEQGWIYGRGTQDMKCVCMQYLESIARLVASGTTLQRTVHLSFMPDEETGGLLGMKPFVASPDFERLNVGFALDEGLASPSSEFSVFYGERGIMWLRVMADGPTGHGSRFVKDAACPKLIACVNRLLAYRDAQEARLLSGQHHSAECAHALSAAAASSKQLALGDVVTLNLTMLDAGVSVDGGITHSLNVIPQTARAGFDIRLPPHVDMDEFESKIQQWTCEAGCTYQLLTRLSADNVVCLDEHNPYWQAFVTCMSSMHHTLSTQIFPAGTDSRFLRQVNIPCIGFSPINNTPILLHDHDERLHRDVFVHGIAVYQQLVTALTSVMHEPTQPIVYAAPKIPLKQL